MQGASLDELRDLSKRSRRSQRTGFVALVAMLAHVPLMVMFPAWGAYASVVAGGGALLGYAFVAGQERGAFRRVFRRIREDRQATRSIVPSAPALVEVVEK